MEIIKGIPVSPGVAIGNAFILDSEEVRIPERFAQEGSEQEEIHRFEKALQDSRTEVRELQEEVSQKIGTKYSAVFNAHFLVLSDDQFINDVHERISRNCFTAEYAVSRVLRKYVKAFRAMENAYLSQRISDIYDVEKRVLKHLLGHRRESLANIDEPVVVITHDLTPSQTASFDRGMILGLATDIGGRTSHAAIMARAMEIPAVVGLDNITSDISGGDTIIVDGNRGMVVISPDQQTLNKYKNLQKSFVDFEKTLVKEKDLPAITTDGKKVEIYANIEFAVEVKSALDHGADGVGLYRTEYLYVASRGIPSEEQHFQAYKTALSLIGGKPLTVRTLDLGADKMFDTDLVAHEKNPFLGCRSIRLSFARPDIFKTQLRAILRASVLGDVRILLPMISNSSEITWAKNQIEAVKEELDSAGGHYTENIKVGIMIETPAAAIMSQQLARQVDFFSIGTNDLIQYTFAVDRTNEKVANLYDPGHPAVLKLLDTIIKAGNEAGIEVSMCGEMASDTLYVPLLLGMGLPRLSIAPSSIPEVKKIIRSISMDQSKQLASKCLTLNDSNQITDILRSQLKKILPDAPMR